ncbi:hypothetical protein V6N13_069009 [Hibiscus sabdariffa]|uniref:Phospholipase A1 n=1 Tax=Hibiscus sabdariffa TaxID=183260 RepID=A0ABR2QPB8_9ROSI
MVASVRDLFNSRTRGPDASEENFFSEACLVKGNPYRYEERHFDCLELRNNFLFTQRATASESDLFPGMANVKVHRGFYSLYTGTKPDSDHNKTSARVEVLEAVKGLVDKYKGEEISITVTGFSLGAALATLTAMDIVTHGYNKTTTYVDKNTAAKELDHDIALVNKHLDCLKAECRIPPNWWAGENRNRMLQLENGRWEHCNPLNLDIVAAQA